MPHVQDAAEYGVNCDAAAALNLPMGNPEILLGHIYSIEFPNCGIKCEYKHKVENPLSPSSKIDVVGLFNAYKFFPTKPTGLHFMDTRLFEENHADFQTAYFSPKGGSELKIKYCIYKYKKESGGSGKWYKHVDSESELEYQILTNAYFGDVSYQDVQNPKCFQSVFTLSPAKEQKMAFATNPDKKIVVQVGT